MMTEDPPFEPQQAAPGCFVFSFECISALSKPYRPCYPPGATKAARRAWTAFDYVRGETLTTSENYVVLHWQLP